MKIEKRGHAWWIVQVPPYRVEGVVQTTCGPYDSFDEAADDLAGLERFFQDNPAYDTILLAAPDERPRGYAGHWFVKSLLSQGRLRSHRPLVSSPGQKTLPGMNDA